MNESERTDKLVKLIERTSFINLGTVDKTGSPLIKVVTRNVYDEFRDFWFVTMTHRNRTRDIERDGRSCLYFADNENYETLLLKGKASITRDSKILDAMWNDEMYGMFPAGTNDPEYTAIAFHTEAGNFYCWPWIGEFTLNNGEISWIHWHKNE